MEKNKSITRYIAIQAFYCMLNQKTNKEEIFDFFLKDKDFDFLFDFEEKIEKSNFDKLFLKELLRFKIRKKKKIEKLIYQNLDKSWKLERLPVILHSILISAISEMLLNPNLPLGIIVTEYLKLTDCFFLEGERAFVNAILEKVHSIILIENKSN